MSYLTRCINYDNLNSLFICNKCRHIYIVKLYVIDNEIKAKQICNNRNCSYYHMNRINSTNKHNFCVECQQYIPDISNHSNQHILSDLEIVIDIKCKGNITHTLDAYCIECKKPYCSICCKEHTNHKVLLLKNYVSDAIVKEKIKKYEASEEKIINSNKQLKNEILSIIQKAHLDDLIKRKIDKLEITFENYIRINTNFMKILSKLFELYNKVFQYYPDYNFLTTLLYLTDFNFTPFEYEIPTCYDEYIITLNSYNYYLKTHYIIIPFEENLSSIHPIPQYDTNFNQINFFPFYVKSMFVRKNGTLVIGFIDGTINFYDPFSFQIILTYHLEGEVRLEVIENLKYSEEKIIVFDSAGAVYELILTEDNQLKKGKEISLQKCTNIKELNNGTLLFFNARNHIMHHCEKDNYTIIQTFNKVSSIRSICQTKNGIISLYIKLNSIVFYDNTLNKEKKKLCLLPDGYAFGYNQILHAISHNKIGITNDDFSFSKLLIINTDTFQREVLIKYLFDDQILRVEPLFCSNYILLDSKPGNLRIIDKYTYSTVGLKKDPMNEISALMDNFIELQSGYIVVSSSKGSFHIYKL